MTWVLDRVGRHIAAYLQRPATGYEPFTPTDPEALKALIKPGDIEGRTHIAGVIKYLTQSTWSHAALYVGPIEGQATLKRRALRSGGIQHGSRHHLRSTVHLF